MFSLKVEQYAEPVGTNPGRLKETKYYIRLGSAQGLVYLQGGKAWYEGGQEADPLPEWVQTEIDQLTPDARKSVGFSIPEPAPELKTCPTCATQVPPSKYPYHMASHARQQHKATKYQ